MTYTILFLIGIIIAVIIGALADDKKQKLVTITHNFFRGLSILGAVGIAFYLLDILFKNLREDFSFSTIAGSIVSAIAILALCNLIYYATAKHNEQKKRANIAEYKLHLINKGTPVQEVLDPSYKSTLYGSTLDTEAKEWAEKAAAKSVKTYYD